MHETVPCEKAEILTPSTMTRGLLVNVGPFQAREETCFLVMIKNGFLWISKIIDWKKLCEM